MRLQEAFSLSQLVRETSAVSANRNLPPAARPAPDTSAPIKMSRNPKKFHASPQISRRLTRRLVAYGRRRRPLCLLDCALPIANSSVVRPALRAAVNHRGCFPRPDQVSYGGFEFRYLGNTGGYLRWGRSSDARSTPRLFVSMRSRANRFSSSRFSETRRADNIWLSCS